MVRKPDNSGWINNVNAFGPIPLNERVYIACVFAPNDHITVYTYCPSQGFRKTSSSAAGVSGSYRSEHMGGINVPYAYDYMNGVVYIRSRWMVLQPHMFQLARRRKNPYHGRPRDSRAG